ncbi:hypothetical protein COLO4_21584 [Corchorus olitorius]|uniref:Uncharacterized protein n=1 Tax=Corchorus olitorius TaxID=93759 RepID=A0A1R3ISJ3_9ROSI|nr:hypothetical protein COLO4_21584 [Corchorus olitorius]
MPKSTPNDLATISVKKKNSPTTDCFLEFPLPARLFSTTKFARATALLLLILEVSDGPPALRYNSPPPR